MTKRKKEVDYVEKKLVIHDVGGKEVEVPELDIVNVNTPPVSPIFLSDDQMDYHKSLTDHALHEQLERNKTHLVKFGPNLPDKGEKIRFRIASLEEEKQRRILLRSKMMDTQTTKSFGKELEHLGCESGKHTADKDTVTRPDNGCRMLSKVGKAEHSKGSKGNEISKGSCGKKGPKASSSYSLLDDDDTYSNGHKTPRELSCEESPSQSSKRRKKSDNKVINVDEEESQPSTVAEQVVELPEGLQKDICYPSRDDPDFVQVCLKDLECLAPREFLTSPVMNFYIRFLQQQVSSVNQISADCHFFNTYFYKKLTEAVTYKGNDTDAIFVKFRRWWKGIDLFRKAYIFIPIHEDLHWSLVIVCIPDKEDELGLTILHLDSLGLHSKKSIVENVKRFLKDEWNYLNQDDYSSDLPISENIWRNLPRRISQADIQVPQQKNEFDCGPFVLFFIKQFIEEAPQRLKRKDLGMFDKKWFRPAEASALRIKILNTLIDLFHVSNQTDKTCIEQNTSDEIAASKSRHCSPLID